MTQYISKDALVAEIEKRLKFQQTCIKTGYRLTGKAEEEIILEYNQLLSFLDTLEVKEVDLDKEIELVKGDYEQVDVAWNNDFDFIAKHFFELGLKLKGEKSMMSLAKVELFLAENLKPDKTEDGKDILMWQGTFLEFLKKFEETMKMKGE